MQNENYLIEKIKKGDHRAFKKLFDDYAPKLYRFLFQFSGQRDEVEDWVQGAFVNAYQNIASFRGESGFSTWLFRIGINLMKKSKRRNNFFDNISETTEIGDHCENPAEDFEWENKMKKYFSGIPELNKAVFILSIFEEYSHNEISVILGISPENSRIILFRTKKILRSKIESEINNEQY